MTGSLVIPKEFRGIINSNKSVNVYCGVDGLCLMKKFGIMFSVGSVDRYIGQHLVEGRSRAS